ncbi:hypothetical protein ABXT70_02625 [Candidatus Njordibacter sp. Uisw_039]|uniref:hypothetical protein n=1 Tax=Candidatus Njordibacter sp. Uisw_039 TaxID=3230972 RepID=UPI0035920AD2
MIISIKDIFFGANKKLAEGIKYGGLAFNVSNALIGGIYTYNKHISIEFSNGSGFTDTDSILEGSGKKRRHKKYTQMTTLFKKMSLILLVKQ